MKVSVCKKYKADIKSIDWHYYYVNPIFLKYDK